MSSHFLRRSARHSSLLHSERHTLCEYLSTLGGSRLGPDLLIRRFSCNRLRVSGDSLSLPDEGAARTSRERCAIRKLLRMQEMFCMLVHIERCEEQHSTKWNQFLKLPNAFTPLTCLQAGLVPIRARNPLGARTGWLLLSREGFWIGFVTRACAPADQSTTSRSIARLRSETAQRAIPEAGPDRDPRVESGR